MPLLLPTPENIAQLASLLRAGEVAALPTETVYGLAADATNASAVLKIYAAKGRPRFNPLIVHVADSATAQYYGQFNQYAQALAQAFWPGPLTLVVPYKQTENTIPDVVRAGLPSLALRVPAHPLMQAVLQQAGVPLAAPSANKSGHVSATQAAHVLADFGDALPVLEGGPCRLGLESTIIDCTTAQPTLLRAGALTTIDIENVLGLAITNNAQLAHNNAPKAPGMLLQHYAPRARVRLNATHLNAGEALLAFGPTTLQATLMANLSPTADTTEAALNLFAMLRELDSANPSAIAVMPIPTAGLGEAIADRLARAAAG